MTEITVLFLCTANIARSAYAEHRARALAPDLGFASAGTHALVGEPIYDLMAHELSARIGVLPDHVAQQVNRELCLNADLILTMTPRHREYVLDEWPTVARKTYLIGQAAREIGSLEGWSQPTEVADHLWRRRTVRRGDAVQDPYLQGSDAARQCARTLDTLLVPLVQALQQG